MKLILARLLGVMYIKEVLYFAVLSDRCLVGIYSASQYFHYFGQKNGENVFSQGPKYKNVASKCKIHPLSVEN
jgi:hypothetical protein